MKTIKKAYRVWHLGMISDNPHEGYSLDTVPVVYAETPSKAKSIATEPYEYDLPNKYNIEYTDLHVKRAKNMDIVLYNNVEILKWLAEQNINNEKRINERKIRIEQYPDGTSFFVQNGYVGNSVLWWKKGCAGYTTDINLAQVFIKEEILEKFINGREEDKIWEFNHVMSKITNHVDAQKLDYKYQS